MPSKGRFRPRLWPTLITLSAVIVMLGFSVWQLERRAWKHELIARRVARIAAPSVPLPAKVDPKLFEFRKMSLRGRFLHAKELYVGARSLRSNLGYHVYTPFAANDGTVVLVNRGWIPLARKEPSRRR
ncbi:MAG: SURF1 family protein, partial [Alphaproteobacteria bacterium]|nr:SURF1 family protein [Alphaproteobacteria bacterium]